MSIDPTTWSAGLASRGESGAIRQTWVPKDYRDYWVVTTKDYMDTLSRIILQQGQAPVGEKMAEDVSPEAYDYQVDEYGIKGIWVKCRRSPRLEPGMVGALPLDGKLAYFLFAILKDGKWTEGCSTTEAYVFYRDRARACGFLDAQVRKWIRDKVAEVYKRNVRVIEAQEKERLRAVRETTSSTYAPLGDLAWASKQRSEEANYFYRERILEEERWGRKREEAAAYFILDDPTAGLEPPELAQVEPLPEIDRTRRRIEVEMGAEPPPPKRRRIMGAE